MSAILKLLDMPQETREKHWKKKQKNKKTGKVKRKQ